MGGGREDGPRCVLTSSEFGSYELRPGGVVRIGRHAKNEVVIDDPAVSRFHARIVWDPGRELPELIDSGSQNGTTVDDRCVGICTGARDGACLGEDCLTRRAELRHESQIRIHHYPIFVELERHALLEGLTDRVRLFSELRRDLAGELLSNADVQPLLTRLEDERRTGTLQLERPDGARAQVVYCLGRIMWAEAPEGVRTRALERILQLGQASYRFTPDLVPQEDAMNLWLSDYLAARAG